MRFPIVALSVAGIVTALPSAEPIADPQFSENSLHLERGPASLVKRSSSGQIFSENGGNSFLTNIQFGTQTFKVVIDTGSSDTWLIGNGYQCLNAKGKPVPESMCDFGKAYKYKMDTTLIQDATESGENFELAYGDGEFLTGILATDTVDLAGVTFKTEVGVCLEGYWNGDGVSSGLVGLAFPLLTSAYYGTDPSTDGPSNKAQYDPIMYQLFETNAYKPALFSLALSRDISNTGYGGSLTIGGVPNLSDPKINAKANYAYADFEPAASISSQYLSFYAISVDSVTVGSGSSKFVSATNQYVIDSGTSLIYVPSKLAAKFNSLWQGNVVHQPKLGQWIVPCDSPVPPFSVTISGKSFTVNPKDLLQPNGDGTCLSTVLDVLDSPTLLLGDVFLKNVLAVFDWGNQRMGICGPPDLPVLIYRGFTSPSHVRSEPD